MKDKSKTLELLRRAAEGDTQARDAMLTQHRTRLIRMVQARLNPQLQGRVDASDVLQEAYVEIVQRLEAYLKAPQAPFFLWIRSIIGQKIIDVHRRHLGTDMRDATREVPLGGNDITTADSGALEAILVAPSATPSHLASQAENRTRVREALDGLSPVDREVLHMRHFEQRSNVETAQALGLSESGATARHVRAIKRLKARVNEYDISST